MTKSCFSAKDWHILCRHMQKQIFPAQVLPAPCSATLARFDLANCSDHRARCAVLSMGELSPEWWQQLPYHRELGIILFTVLPVWACGAVIGLLVCLRLGRAVQLDIPCLLTGAPPSRHAAGHTSYLFKHRCADWDTDSATGADASPQVAGSWGISSGFFLQPSGAVPPQVDAPVPGSIPSQVQPFVLRPAAGHVAKDGG